MKYRPYFKSSLKNFDGKKQFLTIMREISGSFFIMYEVPEIEQMALRIFNNCMSVDEAIEVGQQLIGA